MLMSGREAVISLSEIDLGRGIVKDEEGNPIQCVLQATPVPMGMNRMPMSSRSGKDGLFVFRGIVQGASYMVMTRRTHSTPAWAGVETVRQFWTPSNSGRLVVVVPRLKGKICGKLLHFEKDLQYVVRAKRKDGLVFWSDVEDGGNFALFVLEAEFYDLSAFLVETSGARRLASTVVSGVRPGAELVRVKIQ